MRTLRRNEKPYVAFNLVSKTPILDDNGDETGAYLHKYSKPIHFRANANATSGGSQLEAFGLSERYDKVMVMSLDYFKKNKFDENTVFFIDKKVSYDKEGCPEYNYRIKRTFPTINEITIGLEMV